MSEHFEQQVKHLLDEVQFEPKAGVWHNVRDAIQPVKRKRRFIFWWILPVALTAGGLIYLLNNNNHDNRSVSKTTVHIPTTTNQPDTVDQPVQVIIKNNKERFESARQFAGKEITEIANQIKLKHKPVSNSIQKNNYEINQTQTTNASDVNDLPAGELNSNTPERITAIKTPDTIAATVKSVITPEAKIASNDSVNSGVNVPVEKMPSKRSNWVFGLSADLGTTNATGGDLFGFEKKEYAYAGLGNPAGPASGLSSNMYQRTTSGGRFSFGIHFTADRKLSKKISLQSSLGYRQQSFSITNSAMKDSNVSGNMYTFLINRSTAKYQFNFINFYTGMSFAIAQLKELKLGIAAGVDNQLMVSAKRKVLLMSNTSISSEKSTSMNGYNKWQPLFRFQFVTSFNTGNQKWLQLSPYFNYGLRNFEKQPATEKDRLASFGITATYFFR